MRHISKIFLSLFIVCLALAPAVADDHHGYDRHNSHDNQYNGRHRPAPRGYYARPGYHGHYDRYYVEPPIIVARPRPVIVYQSDEPYVRVRCASNASITGTIIGGAAGGLIGNQFSRHHRFAPTIGGALIGALIGNQIGAANETCAAQALEYARPDTQVVWEDNNDNSYVVQPVRTYQTNGQYCREYQTRVNVGGDVQQGYGTACRQPDGSWQIIN